MSDLNICRICLRTEAKGYNYRLHQLKYYYEEVTAGKVNDQDGIPQWFCYECACTLFKFHKFKEKCYTGYKLLRDLLWQGPITYEAVYRLDRPPELQSLTLEPMLITDRIKSFTAKCVDIEQNNSIQEKEPLLDNACNDNEDSDESDNDDEHLHDNDCEHCNDNEVFNEDDNLNHDDSENCNVNENFDDSVNENINVNKKFDSANENTNINYNEIENCNRNDSEQLNEIETERYNDSENFNDNKDLNKSDNQNFNDNENSNNSDNQNINDNASESFNDDSENSNEETNNILNENKSSRNNESENVNDHENSDDTEIFDYSVNIYDSENDNQNPMKNNTSKPDTENQDTHDKNSVYTTEVDFTDDDSDYIASDTVDTDTDDSQDCDTESNCITINSDTNISIESGGKTRSNIKFKKKSPNNDIKSKIKNAITKSKSKTKNNDKSSNNDKESKKKTRSNDVQTNDGTQSNDTVTTKKSRSNDNCSSKKTKNNGTESDRKTRSDKLTSNTQNNDTVSNKKTRSNDNDSNRKTRNNDESNKKTQNNDSKSNKKTRNKSKNTAENYDITEPFSPKSVVIDRNNKIIELIKEKLKTVRSKDLDIHLNFDECKKKSLNMDNWKKIDLNEEQAIKEFRDKAKDPTYMKSAFKCTVCFKGFSKKETWKRHHRKRHSDDQTEECRVCKMRFKWKCLLRRHMRQHFTKFECLRCHQVFGLESSAIIHDQSHSGEKKTCFHCNEEFTHLTTYYTHLRSHRSCHVCRLCGEAFVSAAGLRQHHRKRHPDGDAESASDDEDIQRHCKTCNITFETTKAYDEHIFHSTNHGNEVLEVQKEQELSSKIPESPNDVVYSKKILGKRTRETIKKELTKRSARIPPPSSPPKRKKKCMGKKPTTCRHCGVKFPSQRACISHHQKQHPKLSFFDVNERHICELCGASLAPGSVYVHMNMHTKSKVHTCDTCGRQFHSGVGLRRHMLTHTGEKPYACPLCQKRFTQSNSMKLHYKTFHLRQPYPHRKSRIPKTSQTRRRVYDITDDVNSVDSDTSHEGT